MGLKTVEYQKSDNLPDDLDETFTELNLRKVKWIFFRQIIFILNLRSTVLLMLAISLKLSVPHKMTLIG